MSEGDAPEASALTAGLPVDTAGAGLASFRGEEGELNGKRQAKGRTRAPARPAKITPPRSEGVLRRERLLARLDALTRSPVAWVAAPAGAGKTTLVADWLAARGRPHLWYQLDRGDEDPASLFHFLAQALAASGHDGALPGFEPAATADLPHFARRFFAALGDALGPGAVVVLEDHHAVPPGSPLDPLLVAAADALPEGTGLLVTSREAPPPGLAPLVARRRLERLPAEALLLTPEETGAVARLLGHPEVDSHALHARAEGWSAGVVLLLHAVGREGLTIAAADREMVFGYFAGEILDGLPDAERSFLLRTSVAPTLTAELASALCGRRDAGAILRALVRRHLFTLRQGPRGERFRYHPLFRAFLRTRAEAALGAEALGALHETAARHLAEAGELESAATTLAEGARWAALAELIPDLAPTLIARGGHRTLARLLASLPSERLEAAPLLRWWLGVAHQHEDPAAAIRTFQAVLDGCVSAGDGDGALRAWWGIVSSRGHHWHDFRELDRALALRRRLRRRFGEPVALETRALVVAGMLHALAHRRPAWRTVRPWAQQAEALVRTDLDPARRAELTWALATYALWRGDPREAERLLEGPGAEGLPWAEESWGLMRTFQRLYEGRPEEAVAEADAALDRLGRGGGPAVVVARLHAALVYAHLDLGQAEEAETHLRRFEEAPGEDTLLARAMRLHLRALVHVHAGRPEPALRAARAALALTRRTGAVFAESLDTLAVAGALCELGRWEEAEAHALAAWEIARAARSPQVDVHCGLILAEARFALGRSEEGRRALGRALGRARRVGLGGYVWLRPWAVADLCAKALELGLERTFVRDLVRRRRLVPKTVPTAADWPWPVRVRTLGTFEVRRAGAPLGPRAAGGRPLALLRTLVALGGRDVPHGRVEEALWPDAEGDAAYRALKTTVHRLRRLVGEAAIVHEGGRLGLDPRACRTDLDDLEPALERLEAAPLGPEGEAAAQAVRALYRGPFLDGIETPEALAVRARLRSRVADALTARADALTAAGRCRDAVATLEAVLRIDPLREAACRTLMACYAIRGRRAEALTLYRRCRASLEAELAAEPAPATWRLYAEVRAGRAPPSACGPCT